MLRRTLSCILMISLVGSSVLWQTPVLAAVIGMTQVYNYAKSGNVTALKTLKQSGGSIEAVDKYGNTALCRSIWVNDYASFYVLKEAGASTTSPCVSKIPPERIESFSQGYTSWAKGVNSGRLANPIQSKRSAATVASNRTKSTFRGTGTRYLKEESGLSTGAKVGIGVGAIALIGGGIALAAGGGGGGSGSLAPCSGHGTQDEEGLCTCNTGYTGNNCEACLSGYDNYGTRECHRTLGCVNGTQRGDKCVCNDGWEGTLCNTEKTCDGFTSTTCPPHFKTTQWCQSGNTKKYKCVDCIDGYDHYGDLGACYKTLVCQNGGEQRADKCLCPTGWAGELCEKQDLCAKNNCNGRGQCEPTTGLCTSCDGNWDPATNCGTCTLKGDNVTQECQCADGYELLDLTCKLVVVPEKTADAVGKTYTNTDKNQDIYGSKTDTYAVYGSLTSAEAVVGNNITLKNDTDFVSENNMYGLYYDAATDKHVSNLRWWRDEQGGTSTISLTDNIGTGNMYGIYAPDNYVFNIDRTGYGTVGNDYGTTTHAQGSILLQKDGKNGDIYGLRGKFAENVSLYRRGNVQGVIDISNKGNGNVYGIYADSNLSLNMDGDADGSADMYIGNNTAVAFAPAANLAAYTADSCTECANGTANALISINNAGNGNVYGVYSNGAAYNVVALPGVDKVLTATGTISITNSGNGNAYGVYAKGTAQNASLSGLADTELYDYSGSNIEGVIRMTNKGTGTAYGVYGSNASNTSSGTRTSRIEMNNTSQGTLVGLYGKSLNNNGLVSLTGSGIGYGMLYSDVAGSATIQNGSNGNISVETSTGYGIYVPAKGDTIYVRNQGNIFAWNVGIGFSGLSNQNSYILNDGTGTIFSGGNGIQVDGGATLRYIENEGKIEAGAGYIGIAIDGVDTVVEKVLNDTTGIIALNGSISYGEQYGIKVSGGATVENITNKGTIDILDDGCNFGQNYGIYVSADSSVDKIENSGTIKMDSVGGDTYGIYVENGSTALKIINTGTIDVGYGYGIYVRSGTATVTNSGTITAVRGQIYNGGATTASVANVSSLAFEKTEPTVLDLDTSFHNVENVLSLNGRYESDILKGKLGVASTVTSTGFLDEYRVTDAILAQDTSGLNLYSKSALFDASLNGKDVIMTMKSFDEVVDNKSLANFLSANYAAGMNEGFFNTLKSFETRGALTNALDSMSGLDTLTRFTNEDLTVMREVNLAMNDMMFAHNNDRIYEANGSLGAFGFKNDRNSNAQFALGNKRVSSRVKIGYAMSKTAMNTDDNDDTTRRNSLFQVFMPISYNRSGWQMIATPQLGYARAHYTRDGYQGQYDGVIEKRIFALMNEARYPLTFGGLELSPTVEFNAIAYNQKGSEDAKAFALTMPSDNNLSVEAGVGLRAKRTLGNLSLTGSIMAYREFADPYNIKLGMYGLNGTFDLYDDVQEYRGKASFGFNYKKGTIDLYGIANHYMQRDGYTTLKTGLRFAF